MEINRSNIKKLLNDGFTNSEYCKRVRHTNEFETLKTMTFADLDFLENLKTLFEQIKKEYNSFCYDKGWVPSKRQEALIEIISRISEEILNNNDKTNNAIFLHLFDDFYWQIYDYFEDYGNKKETIVKEEIDLIFSVVEEILIRFCK